MAQSVCWLKVGDTSQPKSPLVHLISRPNARVAVGSVWMRAEIGLGLVQRYGRGGQRMQARSFLVAEHRAVGGQVQNARRLGQGLEPRLSGLGACPDLDGF